MSKILCFFDLETNGLPQTKSFNNYYDYKQHDKYDSARIIQMACIFYKYNSTDLSEKFEELNRYNFYIKGDFKIDNTEIHGITNEIVENYGIAFSEAIQSVLSDLLKANYLIAHNILFDRNVLLSEISRLGNENLLNAIEQIPVYCTMQGSKDYLKIQSRYGYKLPKLIELYEFLFDKKIIQKHDAIEDTELLIACTKELIRLNICKL